MIESRFGLIIIAGTLCLGTGCQVIAGIEDRSVDPIPTGCALPKSSGGALIRFANLVPDPGVVDVCVRKAGASYERPVLRGGGSACPSGFSYTQMSAPFSAPEGQVDVKVVAGGSTCKAPALAEALAVPTPKGSSTTLAMMGLPSSGRQLRAYPDATIASASGNMKFRMVHAIANGPALSFGFADANRLPTQIGRKLLVDPLAFTNASRPDSKVTVGRSTPEGYIEIPGTQVSIGAAAPESSRALMVTEVKLEQNGRSIWAIGDANSNKYPLRALLCQDGGPSVTVSNVPLTDCKESSLATLSVDIVNASLTGGRVVEETARRPVLIADIARRDSDLMCLTGVGRAEDRKAIIEQAKASGAFPYSVFAESDLDTEATDARDQDGNVPPKPTVPPCGGTVDAATVDRALQCVIEKCSTTHVPSGQVPEAVRTADGVLTGGTACLSTQCAPLFIALLAGNYFEKRCYDCMGFTAASYETHEFMKTQCTTDVRDYKLFRGATPSIILSKFPIRASETFQLPATLNQRAVHRAEIELEGDSTLDFYCAELSPAYGTLLPNYSAYANNAPSGDDWYEEQKLQTRRVVDFVMQRSATRPAIIAGDWATSRADEANGIAGLNPAVMDLLESVFKLGVPEQGFVPQCTECKFPTNFYNTDVNIWQLKPYLLNMPKGADTASTFWTDDVVPLSIGNGKMGPRSHRWGFNVRILRP